MCVHKICEDKFGGCKKSFSWLGQKVNTNIDGPTTPARTCAHGHGMTPRPGTTSRHCSVFLSNMQPLNIRIRFDSYSKFRGYSIRYLIRIKFQIRPILSDNSITVAIIRTHLINQNNKHDVVTHVQMKR